MKSELGIMQERVTSVGQSTECNCRRDTIPFLAKFLICHEETIHKRHLRLHRCIALDVYQDFHTEVKGGCNFSCQC